MGAVGAIKLAGQAFVGILVLGLAFHGASVTGAVPGPGLEGEAPPPTETGSSVGTERTRDTTRPDDSPIDEKRTARPVFEMVNDQRESRKPDFQWNSRAARAAKKHAEHMAQNNYYSHTKPNGEGQRERYSFCRGGENIHKLWYDKRVQYGSGEVVIRTNEKELATGVVNAWMGSRPHREKGIYGPWSSAGVGIAISDSDEVYAVMGLCQ